MTMSRLANQIKLGYFPTPPSLIDSLAAQLQAPDAHFRWLDVCAGEGIALAMLAERLGGEAFRQIVILRIKRKQRREDQQAQLMLPRAQNSAVPVLPRECTQPYEIPPSTPKIVWYFRPADVPAAVVLAEAKGSGVFQTRIW